MTLLRVARRWRARRVREAANQALRLPLDGATLTRPRLLGHSRAGRRSWKARLDGRPVKIYECHSAGQAALVEAVAATPALASDFPALVARRQEFLVVEWVEGRAIRRRDWRRDPALLRGLGSLQARLHAVSARDLPEPGFSYPAWLAERWRRCQAVFPFRAALERLLEIIEHPPAEPAPRLSHPDVSAANLVAGRAGTTPRLVDNELLSAGPWYPVDLLATHHSFGAGTRDRLGRAYLDAYREAGGETTALAENGPYLEALWRLARVGSLLQDGAIGHAAAEVDAYLRGDSGEHPLIALARRRRGAN